MRVKEAMQSAIRRLQEAQVGSPRLNAETLLMFVLGCDRAYLYAHDERVLSADEQLRYDEALTQRAHGIPAQYITGHQEFWGMDLLVTPAVLVPRPETEHLIETVLELAGAEGGRGGERLRIIDVGTGSGCIALALAQELPTAEVEATDVSEEALEIARGNASRHNLQQRVRFRRCDLLGEFEAASFDFVVSNPPYVGRWDAETVEAQVRKFEPEAAVFAGETGMEVIERLLPQARSALKPGGWLVMEIGHSSRGRVEPLVEDWAEARFIPDLQGIARVLAARK
jgi:release factor glutamine methyltransferase